MDNAERVTLTSLTCVRNAASTLPRLLDSISWIDDKRVVDLGSTDDSVQVAERHGATVSRLEGGQRPEDALDACLERGSEWILVLESDDYLAADAEEEVRRLIEVYEGDYDAFEIPRYSQIAGHVMRGGRWYPDWQTRLFRKGTGRWRNSMNGRPVVQVSRDRCYRLEPPHCLHIHHVACTSLRQFIDQRCNRALHDEYDTSTDTFAFEDYVGAAYEQLAAADAELDGDLAHAVGTLLAWEQILRGVVHWERLGRKAPLARAFSLPIETIPYRSDVLVSEQLLLRNRDLEAQLAATRAGWLWKLSHVLERVRAAVRKWVQAPGTQP